MIEPSHLLRFVIRPTLHELALRSGLPLDSEAAVRLLFATYAHEGIRGGHTYLYQHPNGPARGLYQMEPKTYVDTLARIARWPSLRYAVVEMRGQTAPDSHLEANLAYATACARAYYWLAPAPLPDAADLIAIGRYAKRWWATEHGAATAADYTEAFHRYAPAEVYA